MNPAIRHDLMDDEPKVWDRRSLQTDPSSRYFLYATIFEWQALFAFSFIIALALAPLYLDISLWVGVGVGLFVATSGHLYLASRFILPLPHMAILVGLLQLVLAAWLGYYVPPPPHTDIGTRLPDYMAYAVPGMIAFALGWLLPCWGIGPGELIRKRRVHANEAQLLRELDMLVFGGLAISLLTHMTPSGSLSFPILLLAHTRYVGLFGWVILRAPGWRRRAMILLGFEAVSALAATMLHSLYLVAFSLCSLLLWRFRPSLRTYVTILMLGLIAVPAIETAKWRLRTLTWFNKGTVPEVLDTGAPLTKIDKVVLFGYYFVNAGGEIMGGEMERDIVGHLSQRFNQGWIVNKVMMHVPASEPYARGETIWTSFISAIVPRIIVPEKYRAGGQDAMLRFAGYKLAPGTSMNLGYLGEMWANFGYFGGILGCAFYALGFGVIFRALAKRATTEPLWWIFVPLIFHWAIKAESGLPEVISWTAKSLVICAVVIFAMPALRMRLLPPRMRVEVVRPGFIDSDTMGYEG